MNQSYIILEGQLLRRDFKKQKENKYFADKKMEVK